jgi:hypothetical protein
VAKGLRSGLAHGAGGGLGAIAEDDEEEEEEEESGGSGSAADVPQCFSHFTYVMTGGQKLVCDLQVRAPGTMHVPVSHDYSACCHERRVYIWQLSAQENGAILFCLLVATACIKHRQ